MVHVSAAAAQQPAFKLAPAVAVEAEDFHIESGWRIVKNGHGNYMVDMIGFCHISGERLLCVDAKDKSASAFTDLKVPVAGDYRLWVRYEYPAFCETRFRVIVQQDKKTLIDRLMGAKDSPRYAFGDPKPKAQHDPAWGPEGVMEEVVTVPGLKAGPARIYLKATEQPQIPGVSAGRHIDLIYLTSDTKDAWMAHYAKQTNLYPILDAFRDTRGPRYQVRFTNRGDKPASFSINHTYNRVPWYVNEGVVAKDIKPGASSDWIGIRLQDTCHYHLATFSGGGQPFAMQLRAVGGAVEREAAAAKEHAFYLPPYPGKGDKPITPIEAIDAVLKLLADTPSPGKKPTLPLCYGGWMPLGQDNDYGKKYAQLYAALGMRSLHPANSGPAQLKNLEAAGVPATKSWMVMGYRNPPTKGNIDNAKKELAKSGMDKYLLWYDYGDEIAFSEWMGMLVQEEVDRAKAKGKKTTPAEVTAHLWQAWLKARRPSIKAADYWLARWGAVDEAKLRPDSSAAAAVANPRLYVDSLLFYEDAAIAFAANGARAARKALGEHVLCGANYSCHPFYYPTTAPYIKWFRGGAADMGRHSEYFWQVAQPGPMINGYITEHFRAGFRYNPRGVIRQYTMPHAPGNTDANFTRSCFSHLAHGAKMLDFFGIGMNESFTENHIDIRAHSRYQVVRDVTHSIGLVEDLLVESTVVPSPVALLVSDSTERWDFAGIATDSAGHDHFGPNFRKARLNSHLERFGIWQALTFQGVSPDLLIEDDLNAKVLKQYKVLVIVGDCLAKEAVPALKQWVEAGGVLLATAESGRFGSYREPNLALRELLGLRAATTTKSTTFFRPRQELPFLKPLSTIVGTGWEMPQLALRERITPELRVKVLARFKEDDSPAMYVRGAGKGRVYYVAALPGVASLWSALQPPIVPDRGPSTHSIPTAFDEGARKLLQRPLQAAGIEPLIVARPALIDARLLRTPRGYILPLANYHDKVGQKVTLALKVDAKIAKVTSAQHGVLPSKMEKGRLVVTVPALGYGDVLRLDVRQ
jgi:hypothetical protein